ncbi:hypothetical protein DDT52_00730 [Brenneria roseae subsp. roseae]|uniref:hypothetical protein n=1 Tax=Brenneria roseae TaxID=1509241 RepID=UPI000D608B1E|nr:hypothetical protein [Brenneria roseae]PWC22828.1 hypothetical protein DDT52_00730 [Brenneria roseae subsp. roseae]
MINKIIFIVVKILNYSLLFHTSIDDNFDTIEKMEQVSHVNVRISLITIPFGSRIFYFLTYKKEGCIFFEKENFNSFFVLDYDLKWGRKKEDIIESLVNDYKIHIDNQPIEKIKNQDEFLKQKISENNDSMSTVRNKITHYTTIMLALTGALTYLYTKISIADLSNYLSLFFCYLLIIITAQIINLALFLRKGMMVSSFYQSSFKDLKNSSYKHELTKSLYRDWLAKNDDVRYFSGIVKNSEKYLYRAICIGIIAFIIITLSSGSSSEIKTEIFLSVPDTHII